MLDPEYKIFVIHVASLSAAFFSSTPLDANIHPFCRPQIASLIVEEVFTKISDEYIDFADIFSLDLAFKLFKHPRINNHAIKLVDGQQPPYRSIYNLRPIELETLKAYIETNLANEFIKPSKFLANSPIFFNRKSDGFLCFCVNYRGLNNLTIKNRYLLPLIEKLLDRLRRAKQFIQLNLINVYHQMRIR